LSGFMAEGRNIENLRVNGIPFGELSRPQRARLRDIYSWGANAQRVMFNLSPQGAVKLLVEDFHAAFSIRKPEAVTPKREPNREYRLSLLRHWEQQLRQDPSVNLSKLNLLKAAKSDLKRILSLYPERTNNSDNSEVQGANQPHEQLQDLEDLPRKKSKGAISRKNKVKILEANRLNEDRLFHGWKCSSSDEIILTGPDGKELKLYLSQAVLIAILWDNSDTPVTFREIGSNPGWSEFFNSDYHNISSGVSSLRRSLMSAFSYQPLVTEVVSKEPKLSGIRFNPDFPNENTR
jgi:hypothetical protein